MPEKKEFRCSICDEVAPYKFSRTLKITKKMREKDPNFEHIISVKICSECELIRAKRKKGRKIEDKRVREWRSVYS